MRKRSIKIDTKELVEFSLWLSENRTNCAVEFAMQQPNKFLKFCKDKYYDSLNIGED